MSMHVDLDGIPCDEIIVDLKEHDAKVRANVIDEFVNSVIGNSTLKSTGEIVIEIRMDIFNFIYKQMKGEVE